MKKSLTRILSLIGLVLLIAQCQSPKQDDSLNPEFAAHISSFTAGVISSESEIFISLVQAVEGVEVGSLVDNQDLLQVEPKIKGFLYWDSPRTLRFVPDEKLPSNQQYFASFQLGELVAVPEKLKNFDFQFQTMPQSIFVQYNGLEAYNAEKLAWQKITGSVQFADVVTQAELSQLLRAKQAGKELNISYEQQGNRKQFTFTIDSVSRKEAEQKLTLSWQGEVVDSEDQGSLDIVIPPLGDFKVISTSVVSLPDQHVVIHFSDPVNTKQDLNGLIYTEEGYDLRTEVKGNKVYLFPAYRLSGSANLHVEQSVKNSMGYQMVGAYADRVTFENMLPKVEMLGSGVIVPGSQGWVIPFRAVNLKAVNVKVIQVFEKNIAQFFQVNQPDETRELKRVGRLVLQQEIPLTSEKPIDYSNWNQFSLDLGKFVEKEPGAIYRVVISFSPQHSLYPCDEALQAVEEAKQQTIAAFDNPNSYYYYEDYNYHNGYRWDERDDPCKLSYYWDSERIAARNFIASEIGLIAKAGTDNHYHFVVTNINTTEPMAGVKLRVLNYPNRELKTITTDQKGFADVVVEGKPFLLIAEKGNKRGYLRLDNQQALSMSMFDVSGNTVQDGLKGLIYGERGVWRPGDSLFLSFMLHDQARPLPNGHPIVFELFTPQNQLYHRAVHNKSDRHIYDFKTRTLPDDATGNWLASVKIGNAKFTKTVKIETVKPNRLKVKLRFDEKLLTGGETGKLSSAWLHGAKAKFLKAKVNAVISSGKTAFSEWEDYTFENALLQLETEEIELFDGSLDANGETAFAVNLGLEERKLPGMLNVRFKNRVFENGGDFSSDYEVFRYSPYSSYVGVQLPKTNEWGNAIRTDLTNVISIASVNHLGKGVKQNKVVVKVYDVRWRWWWDRSSDESLGSYISNNSRSLVLEDTIAIANGKGEYKLKFPNNSYGRKVIVVEDLTSGHSSSQVFYTTYGGWQNNADNNPGGAEMLQFTANKNSYAVGEEATFELPVFEDAMALVSVENGSSVLSKFWVPLDKVNHRVILLLSSDMAPNVFVHITVIQPHQHGNDLPIRLYGVQALEVNDDATILQPQLKVPQEIRPESMYTIQVAEQKGQRMEYTLAVVDEGLLDLTKFQAPNPHNTFYAREALGVYTWDLYNYVSGAFSGEMAGLMAVGGDEAGSKKADAKANRFKPVVKCIGPFVLEKGKTASHQLKMDNYVGSVKVMVVAGNGNAYGKAEETIPVKQPLMVLATAPRVVGPSEEMTLPVTVFAMDKKVKSVKVTLKTNNMFSNAENSTAMLAFDQIGDETVYFNLKAASKLGVGKIDVEVQSAGEKASYSIEIQVRPSNAMQSKTKKMQLKPGETIEMTATNFGISGTNSHELEISGFPDLNFTERLDYLLRYPYGCIEQTTSSVFPQLYLQNILALTEVQKKAINENVIAGINRLKGFQHSDGGMSYWPGNSETNTWGTNYAGHFMIEAQSQGYKLPVGFLSRWQSFQTKMANQWTATEQINGNNDQDQAYRLFTLALSGKPALGAMNRMREWGGCSNPAKWRLAGAYALAGKSQIAKEIMKRTTTNKNVSNYWEYTYGSAESDMAMLLEMLVIMGDRDMSKSILDDLLTEMKNTTYYTTQSCAYTLLAISKWVGSQNKGNAQYVVHRGGASEAVDLAGKLSKEQMKPGEQLKIKNNGTQTLYLNMISSGIPAYGKEVPEQKDIELQVKYSYLNGKSVDITNLQQGTDIVATVTVKHPGLRKGYSNVALTQIFPSGWEIVNTRLNDEQQAFTSSAFDYQDIRDDRVNTFFSLNRGETKTFRVMLSATYAGLYYLPGVHTEVMYTPEIRAIQKGKWIRVLGEK